jgi:hypothetical protein
MGFEGFSCGWPRLDQHPVDGKVLVAQAGKLKLAVPTIIGSVAEVCKCLFRIYLTTTYVGYRDELPVALDSLRYPDSRHGEPRVVTLDGFEATHAALRRMGMNNEFNYRWDGAVGDDGDLHLDGGNVFTAGVFGQSKASF